MVTHEDIQLFFSFKSVAQFGLFVALVQLIIIAHLLTKIRLENDLEGDCTMRSKRMILSLDQPTHDALMEMSKVMGSPATGFVTGLIADALPTIRKITAARKALTEELCVCDTTGGLGGSSPR